jgi:hypothetical protein
MSSWSPLFVQSGAPVRRVVGGVRSVLWPGAAAITDGTTWTNVYVGWGLKRGHAAQIAQPAEILPAPAVLLERNDLPPPPPKPEQQEE